MAPPQVLFVKLPISNLKSPANFKIRGLVGLVELIFRPGSDRVLEMLGEILEERFLPNRGPGVGNFGTEGMEGWRKLECKLLRGSAAFGIVGSAILYIMLSSSSESESETSICKEVTSSASLGSEFGGLMFRVEVFLNSQEALKGLMSSFSGLGRTNTPDV